MNDAERRGSAFPRGAWERGLGQAFDADVFEVPNAAGVVGLEGDGAAGGVEEAEGALGRTVDVVGFGVVEDLLAVDGSSDALAVDDDGDFEPLGFIDRRSV